MPRGRLEGILTLTSSWTCSATNGSGGPSTCTVAAGSYTVTELCTALQTALNAGRPSGWTVTRSFGESGTGLVTINCSSTPWAITWTTAELGQQVGHTVIGSRSSSLASTSAVIGLWLPDCPYWSPFDQGDTGAVVTDLHQTVSPTGVVKTLYGNQYTMQRGIRWEAVSKARVRSYNASSTLAAFEQWWQAVHLGEGYTAFTAGSPIAFYPTADSDSYTSYKLMDLGTFEPAQTAQGWVGLFRVELPRMIKVPS